MILASKINVVIMMVVVTLSDRPVPVGPAIEDPSLEPLTRTGIEVIPIQNVE